MLSQREKTLIVGIGSAHGDDQAGWLVVDEIARQFPDRSLITVRRASVPLDLIDWLDDVRILHLVDAVEVSDDGRGVYRLRWQAGTLVCLSDNSDTDAVSFQQPCRSSHGFSVTDVLRLAEKTDLLPETIVVWAIPGSDFQPGSPLTELCRNNIRQAVTRLLNELSVAYA